MTNKIWTKLEPKKKKSNSTTEEVKLDSSSQCIGYPWFRIFLCQKKIINKKKNEMQSKAAFECTPNSNWSKHIYRKDGYRFCSDYEAASKTYQIILVLGAFGKLMRTSKPQIGKHTKGGRRGPLSISLWLDDTYLGPGPQTGMEI